MRLFHSATSPFARKVRIAILEKDLDERIDVLACNPFDDVAELKAVNPLGKVPALILDDGSVLYDSPVIIEYLDGLSEANRLIPPEGEPRWRVLRQQALGDGIMDAAVSIIVEQRRPDEQRSPHWLGRWQAAIERGLDSLETEVDGLGEGIDLGRVTLGSMLGYLDFRLPDLAWRDGHPKTAAWFATFSKRQSLAMTKPKQ